jgi:tetratricopeptide (TPR) repeat protein
MPSRKTIDGAHTAFTDHAIRRHRGNDETAPPPANLIVWRPAATPFAQRNEALAYLSAGESAKSAALTAKAFPLLVNAQKQFPKDADVTAGLALVLLWKGLTAQSAQAFELANRLRPEARFLRDAASAWEANRNWQRAIDDLQRAIALDRSDENAYRMLIEVARKKNDRELEKQTIDLYLQFRPDSIEFRQRKMNVWSKD